MRGWPWLAVACADPVKPDGFGAACDADADCPEDLRCYLESPGFAHHCTVPCDVDADCRFDDGWEYYCSTVCVRGSGEH